MVNKLLRNSEYYPLFLRHIRHEMVTAHPDGLLVYANTSKLTAFSISISYLLNVHPCRQRVADLLRNEGRRAATPCRQR